MTNFVQIFNNLRRPKLLIRAAKIGSADYKRSRDLRRLTRASRVPNPTRAMELLLALEAQFEAVRKSEDGTYSVVKHVDVLSALIAEYQLLTGQSTKVIP